jgi:hypothetical protein
MRFLLLLYGDEAAEAALGAEGRRQIVEEHMAFSVRLRDEGKLIHGEGLNASRTARTLRRRDRTVTDGPYAETHEQLGGFYLVECADMDEALRIAGELPGSPSLIVEVRPVETG